MTSNTWSYRIRDINNSINLLDGSRKFGTLYGVDRHAEARAKMITAVPEMCSLLVECTEFLEDRPECTELVGRIEALLVRVSNKGG